MRLLLDTHIWIWWVIGSEDLPQPLRVAIDESFGKLWLAPISLWEASVLAQKGRLRLSRAFSDWAEEALDKAPVREAPMNFEVAKAVESLELPHGDPADHFLAATARIYGLSLVTMDRNLIKASDVPTLTV